LRRRRCGRADRPHGSRGAARAGRRQCRPGGPAWARAGLRQRRQAYPGSGRMSDAAVPSARMHSLPWRAALSRACGNDGRRVAAAYALSAPALVLMLALLIGPLLAVVVIACTDYQLGDRTLRFVGLANFRTLAREAVFWKALGNTALYVLVVAPGSVALGL